jgi:hypothetical protein
MIPSLAFITQSAKGFPEAFQRLVIFAGLVVINRLTQVSGNIVLEICWVCLYLYPFYQV